MSENEEQKEACSYYSVPLISIRETHDYLCAFHSPFLS